MPKSAKTISVRLPPYHHPRNEWRKEIHAVVVREAERRGIAYTADDQLEVWIKLYFDDRKVRFVDVDNRVKDVLDALQGQAGGPKTQRLDPMIIPNDSQVYRVMVEKGVTPRQSRGMGHLKIRRFNPSSRLKFSW
jgi:Holliday junction resolvase RusA-like endonuclease